MTEKFRRIYTKAIGSVLLPVFLFMPITATIQASTNNELAITFKVKNPADNPRIFARYGLNTPRLLFQNTFRVKVPADVYQSMRADTGIAYAEEDRKVTAFLVTTNDPYMTTDATLEDKQWYMAKIHVPEAWDYAKGNGNVTVAIIDTGIHASHLELNDGRIIEGYNLITNEIISANSDSDDNGHGTAVAGVIGAIPNNQKGIAGINWNIKIMPVKALAADGTGDISSVAAGIVWAADHGANIINLSLGGPGFGAGSTLSNAISYAYNKGTLLVAAAGNDLAEHGLNLDAKPVYPVCGDNGENMVLGVAATDINDQKADFSNYGINCVDISAPGKRIITSSFLPSDPANNILIYGSGTSLATPIVSGIAALLKAENPNLSNGEIRKIILQTADNIDYLNQNKCLGGSCNGFLGKGRINALTAVAPKPIPNGTLMKEVFGNNTYIVINNIKRLISDFVFTARGFDKNLVVTDSGNKLITLVTGPVLPPPDGTLIKGPNDPQVFVLDQETKRPLTYLVFISRGYSFANIKILQQAEVDSYRTGDWYWPPDKTMVLIQGNPTVYVMDQQVGRPVTYFVFVQRGLSFKKVIKVSPDEFSHIPPAGDNYWLPPLDGTLIKSISDPSVYLIESGTKRILSMDVFRARNYKFSAVKKLSQAEVDAITPGFPFLTQ